MSKIVKLHDQVYAELDGIRSGGETFSEAVARLLRVYYGLREIANMTEGIRNYAEWRAQENARAEAEKRRRDSPEVPNLQAGEVGYGPARVPETHL